MKQQQETSSLSTSAQTLVHFQVSSRSAESYISVVSEPHGAFPSWISVVAGCWSSAKFAHPVGVLEMLLLLWIFEEVSQVEQG